MGQVSEGREGGVRESARKRGLASIGVIYQIEWVVGLILVESNGILVKLGCVFDSDLGCVEIPLRWGPV